MSQAREHDIYDDWGEVKRISGVLLRYPRSIVLLTSLATLAVCVVSLSRPPVFRSSIELKLDEQSALNPILDDLAVPTGTVDAESAAVDLLASDLLATVVREPSDGRVAYPGHPEYGRRLGLTTLVVDESVGTIAGLLARTVGRHDPAFRVFASFERTERDAPFDLSVRFPSPGRVLLTVPEGAGTAAWSEGDTIAAVYEPDAVIEVRGVRLRLQTVGKPDGRSFRVSCLSEEEAVLWVQNKVSVSALPDRANLVFLSVDYFDARLATEIANAIGANFLEADFEQTRDRVRQIADYADEELELRADELTKLNDEIAAILERFPDAIELEKSFVQLNERRVGVEAKALATSSLRTSLETLHAHLTAGNHAMASRLGSQLDAPLTRKYLDSIAVLTDESLRVERDEAGDYQKVLRLKHTEAEDLLRTTEGRFTSIDSVIRDIEAGRDEALGRLGNETAQPGMVTVDAITKQYIAAYGEAAKELSALEVEFTSEYYAVGVKQKQITNLRTAILSHLRSRRESIALEVEQAQALVDHWTTLLGERPERERERIDAAVEALWINVEETVAARVAGLRQEELDLRTEQDVLETRIAELPEAQRLLANPSMEQESLKRVVTKLLEKKEMAALAIGGILPTAQIVRPALVPRGRISPSLHLSLAIGILLGSILSVGSCLVHERFRGRMTSEADYDLLDLPLYASLSRSKRPLRARGLGSIDDPNGSEADAYRALRARLRGAERDHGPFRTIAITSCLPGEGKTAANIGLALAYALEGRKVLVVDANLGQPTLHHLFDLEDAPGLSETLDGRRHWMQCVQSTSLPRVDVLVAGKPYYSPSDMLSSAVLEGLLKDLGEQYDLVILDLPNAHARPDVSCVAPMLDALLLLYCEETGPTRPLLDATIRSLRASGAHLAGVIRRPRRGQLSRLVPTTPWRRAA